MTPPRKAPKPRQARANASARVAALAPFTADATDQILTTNQGTPVNDDQNSLKSGERGGTLLEDFILREKITTSTTSGSPSASSTRAVQPRTACSASTNRRRR